jgi:regulator of cell morphogenesis and NO signaling
MNHKRIAEIVDENYVHAAVLYYFGIRFYEYSDKTLAQVCEERGLNVLTVIRAFDSMTRNGQEFDYKLMQYPVDLIIEYLKHSHHLFIKQRLPYIAKLIESFEAGREEFKPIEKDLKFVFPIFIEDFIHHIYEEEDTLFSYILTLDKATKGLGNPSSLYFMMEKYSIQRYAMEHEAHDDEMQGIRKITNNYRLHPEAPLHVRVLFAELQSLESELITHARVENEILFPKAMRLESQLKESFKEKIRWN